jgi:uncharacterized protein (TIGR02246 family)
MRQLCAVLASVALVAALGLAGRAQQPGAGSDAEMQKLADQFVAAWNKGDAKTLASMFAAEGIRIAADGQRSVGRNEIQKGLEQSFAGPAKNSKLTVRQGQTSQITPDVRVVEGTYEVALGEPSAPPDRPGLKGRFLNTVVRQDGRWLLAANAAIPDLPAPPAGDQR